MVGEERMTITKIRENLYLGDAQDAIDLITSNPEHINVVMNVAWGVNDPYYAPWEFDYYHIDLTDDGTNSIFKITYTVNLLKSLLLNSDEYTILIHCAAGFSRSPFIIAKALSELENKSVKEVYDEIIEKRGQIVKESIFYGLTMGENYDTKTN